MNKSLVNTLTCGLIGLLSMLAMAQNPTSKRWIGTWAMAPCSPCQGMSRASGTKLCGSSCTPALAGTKVRIKISNTFGDHPLLIGGAHIARRTDAAEIDPTSDRTLKFHGKSSTTVAAGSMVVSDPVALEVPALSDLAVSSVSAREHRGADHERSGNADELRFR